ncbi:hypothetical protein FRB90_008454, partial [Tulasnella sp. 427]
MATQAPAPARQQQQQQQRGQDEGFGVKVMKIVQQVALMFLISLFIKNFIGSKNQTTSVPTPAEPESVAAAAAADPDAFAQPPVSIAPLWPVGSVFDMYVQVTTTPHPALGQWAGDAQPLDSKGLPKF